MLGQADEVLLDRCRAPPDGEQPRRTDTLLPQRRGQRRPRLVIAHDAEARDLAPQGGKVEADVGGPARQRLGAFDREDRDRRVGRQPRGVAVGVAVEHEVADDDDASGLPAVEECD